MPRPEISRKRQIKNFPSRSLLILAGSDLSRRRFVARKRQHNAYCQDNEVSWYDWSCLEQTGRSSAHLCMIAFRRPSDSEQGAFYTDAEIHGLDRQEACMRWATRKPSQFGCLILRWARDFPMFNAGVKQRFLPPPAPSTSSVASAVDHLSSSASDLYVEGESRLWKIHRLTAWAPCLAS